MDLILVVIIMAFLCEYADSTLGMGYGTTLTPLLLLIGFTPIQIVPIILLSELVTGVVASICHQREGNVDFRESQNLRVALVFGLCGMVGALVAASIAVSVPEIWVKRYIAFLIFGLGIFMVWMRDRRFSFSWPGIIGTGLLASFNKGVSGGGYGPLVCSGQIFSGVPSKVAVAITSMAESLVCLVGFLVYAFVSQKEICWTICPYVILGSVLSVPFAAKTVKRINEDKFRALVAISTLVLGGFMLWKDVLKSLVM